MAQVAAYKEEVLRKGYMLGVRGEIVCTKDGDTYYVVSGMHLLLAIQEAELILIASHHCCNVALIPKPTAGHRRGGPAQSFGFLNRFFCVAPHVAMPLCLSSCPPSQLVSMSGLCSGASNIASSMNFTSSSL